MCTRFLFYEGQMACLTDSTNIETSGWVCFLDTETKIGGSQSVHAYFLIEAGEDDYVNPLVEMAIAMKCINMF